MAVEQKVIAKSILCPADAKRLAETLTRESQDGWKLQDITTPVTLKGGPASSLCSAYYWDICYCLLSNAEQSYEYRFEVLPRNLNKEKDLLAINAKIIELAEEGLALARIVHGTSVSADDERPTIGTIAHILVFEKEK